MRTDRPTEAILEATRDLDRRSAFEILAAIHAEDINALAAVGKVLPQLELAVDVLACTLGGGGRWISVGAGTSGRMAMLDAAELPPTFGIAPSRVQAIIAGGPRALTRAVEGAEDDANAGGLELARRKLGPGDAVVAISASGYTPFVLGCLDVAHEVGARTIAITCDPGSPLGESAEISIAPEVGPEVIAGSTRMKGGLAQKMVLHLLSTTVMVRLGYVEGNLMAHLIPACNKLRDRALRILCAKAGVGEAEALERLEASGGNVAAALRDLESG